MWSQGVWDLHAQVMANSHLDPTEDVVSVTLPYTVVFSCRSAGEDYLRALLALILHEYEDVEEKLKDYAQDFTRV